MAAREADVPQSLHAHHALGGAFDADGGRKFKYGGRSAGAAKEQLHVAAVRGPTL